MIRWLTRYDRYAAMQVMAALVLIACVLAGIILLVQSLRFLEMVIEAGANPTLFLSLSFLALPRFFEMILPVALAAAILFTLQRMRADNELAVLPAMGLSPYRVARPMLAVALATALALFATSIWLAPQTLSHMQSLRQSIKTEYSTLLLRDGVFNVIGPHITVYVAARLPGGELQGVMVHDTRPENAAPVTITARRGMLAIADGTPQVIVYDGLRQEKSDRTGALQRLSFDRYVLSLPSLEPAEQRWREPEERTLWELLTKSAHNDLDRSKANEFIAEIHRRLASLLLAPAFALVALMVLLSDRFDRRQSALRSLWVVTCVVMLMILYLWGYALAREHIAGYALMYGVGLGPVLAGFFFFREPATLLKRVPT